MIFDSIVIENFGAYGGRQEAILTPEPGKPIILFGGMTQNIDDRKGFELLRKKGVKTGIITSENTSLVKKRSKKLKLDYLFQGTEHKGKLDTAIKICDNEGVTLCF